MTWEEQYGKRKGDVFFISNDIMGAGGPKLARPPLTPRRIER